VIPITHVIRGKREVIDRLLTGMLSGGHILLKDVPGVGKTTLAQALSRAFEVAFMMPVHGPPVDHLRGVVFHQYHGGRWVPGDPDPGKPVVVPTHAPPAGASALASGGCARDPAEPLETYTRRLRTEGRQDRDQAAGTRA